MGIDVRLEDEERRMIGEGVFDTSMLLPRILERFIKDREKEHPFLSSIDYYGYTIFNRQQMPRFIKEFKELLLAINSEEERDFLLQIMTLAAKCEKSVHTYLYFCGD